MFKNLFESTYEAISRIALMCIMFVFTISFALAVDPQVPAPVSSFGEAVMKLLSSAEGASVAIGLFLEFLFRAIKTKKPLSLIRAGIATLKYVVNVLASVLSYLDKVIPQNVEEFVPAVSQKLK